MIESRKIQPAVLSLSIVFIIIALCFGATYAHATPASEKEAEAQAAYAQLVAMQEYLDEASNTYVEAVAEQERAEAAVEEAQRRIEEATARIADLQTQLSTRARSMYRSGSLSVVDLLLGATTFSEFVNNWDFLNILNQNDANMIQESKTLRAEIEEQKIVLVKEQAIAVEKAEEARVTMEDAQAVVEEIQSIYNGLSAEAAALLAEERAAAEAAAAATASITTGANSDYTSGDYNDDYSGMVDPGTITGRAYQWLGEGEYVWGACSPGAFDCSGFVSYCLTGNYSRLGTTYTFLGWNEVSEPQPGDVCVNSGHCGIYIGDGLMIHAASPGEGIIVGGVQSGMIYVRY